MLARTLLSLLMSVDSFRNRPNYAVDQSIMMFLPAKLHALSLLCGHFDWLYSQITP